LILSKVHIHILQINTSASHKEGYTMGSV